MRVIADFNPITNPVFTMDVPQGIYAGFLFYITGTTAAGQALLATDDVATITMRIADQQVALGSFTGFFNATMRLHGAPAQITPVAGATELSCYIGATPDTRSLPNAYLCERNGAISLQWNSGANLIAELTTTPRVQVYGIEARALPSFVQHYSEITEALGVGGPTPLNSPNLYNVTDVFIRPATPANVNRLTVRRGQNVVHDAGYMASVAISNILNKIELGEVVGVADAAAAVPQFVHIIPAHERTLTAMIGAETTIDVMTTGATNISCLYLSAQFLGNRATAAKSALEAAVISAVKALPRNQQRNYTMISFLQAGRSQQDATQFMRANGLG